VCALGPLTKPIRDLPLRLGWEAQGLPKKALYESLNGVFGCRLISEVQRNLSSNFWADKEQVFAVAQRIGQDLPKPRWNCLAYIVMQRIIKVGLG
jgi:hypothetical protein